MDFLNKRKTKMINNKKKTGRKFNEINVSILKAHSKVWDDFW